MPTFFNQATLTYDGKTVNSNIATGEILEVLSATKTAVINSYSKEDNVPITEETDDEVSSESSDAEEN